MKAIQFDRFGGTAELHLVDTEFPIPGPGQIRVRVRAAGVNALDGKIRSGAMRAAFPTPLPAVPGFEVAGVIDAVGDDVRDVKMGDHVVGWSDTGSYAQLALATTVALKPPTLGWEHAVALPIAGATANHVLDLLDVADGDTVLMHGAAGAVGTVAVQLATRRGAHVVATASAANQSYLTSLGATATTYGDGLVERVRALAPNGVDAVFDLAGKGALEDSMTLRNGSDRIVTIADVRAGELGITFASGPSQRSSALLAQLLQEATAGTLITTVTSFPLERAADAQDASDAGHARGKLVLTVD